MRAAGASPHAAWWHDRSEGLALTMVFDMQRVRHERTARHEVEVFEHSRFGRALAVDGVLQAVAQDAARREMLVHVPLLGRTRRPCRALVVGEDAGVVAEVLKHDFVTSVVVSTDDPALLEITADAFGLSATVGDPRVVVRRPAAGEALADPGGAPFDLMLVASADLRRPAPAASAGTTLLLEKMAARLAPDGVIADSDLALISRDRPRWYRDAHGAGPSLLAAVSRSGALPSIERYFTTSSLGLGGLLGFFLYSQSGALCGEPQSDFEDMHYNADLHRAAFALPTFWSELP